MSLISICHLFIDYLNPSSKVIYFRKLLIQGVDYRCAVPYFVFHLKLSIIGSTGILVQCSCTG